MPNLVQGDKQKQRLAPILRACNTKAGHGMRATNAADRAARGESRRSRTRSMTRGDEYLNKTTRGSGAVPAGKADIQYSNEEMGSAVGDGSETPGWDASLETGKELTAPYSLVREQGLSGGATEQNSSPMDVVLSRVVSTNTSTNEMPGLAVNIANGLEGSAKETTACDPKTNEGKRLLQSATRNRIFFGGGEASDQERGGTPGGIEGPRERTQQTRRESVPPPPPPNIVCTHCRRFKWRTLCACCAAAAPAIGGVERLGAQTGMHAGAHPVTKERPDTATADFKTAREKEPRPVQHITITSSETIVAPTLPGLTEDQLNNFREAWDNYELKCAHNDIQTGTSATRQTVMMAIEPQLRRALVELKLGHVYDPKSPKQISLRDVRAFVLRTGIWQNAGNPMSQILN